MIRKIVGATAATIFAAVVVLSFVINHSYVTTPSMYPTIPPGSEIIVRAQSSYHVGEVIEFRANNLIWAHRLIKINPNGTFVTKGDNPQNSPDVFVPALTQADVIGAVVAAPKWVGFPELILHHPSYGLSWLRAELGLPGKLILVAATLIIVLSGRAQGPKPCGPRLATGPLAIGPRTRDADIGHRPRRHHSRPSPCRRGRPSPSSTAGRIRTRRRRS